MNSSWNPSSCWFAGFITSSNSWATSMKPRFLLIMKIPLWIKQQHAWLPRIKRSPACCTIFMNNELSTSKRRKGAQHVVDITVVSCIETIGDTLDSSLSFSSSRIYQQLSESQLVKESDARARYQEIARVIPCFSIFMCLDQRAVDTRVARSYDGSAISWQRKSSAQRRLPLRLTERTSALKLYVL